MEAVKAGFEVAEDHLALWERPEWRYAFLMGGRGNGRSGTASRYVTSRLLGSEYTRGAILRAVTEDIRTCVCCSSAMTKDTLFRASLIELQRAARRAEILPSAAQAEN